MTSTTTLILKLINHIQKHTNLYFRPYFVENSLILIQ